VYDAMRINKSELNFTQTLDVTITEKRIGQLLHSTPTPGVYRTNKGHTFEFVSPKHDAFCTYLTGYVITFEYTYHPPQLSVLVIRDIYDKYIDWVLMSRWVEQFDIPIVPLVYIGPLTPIDYRIFKDSISDRLLVADRNTQYTEGYILRTSGDEFYKIKTPWYQDISQRAKTLKHDAVVWKMAINGTLHSRWYLSLNVNSISDYMRNHNVYMKILLAVVKKLKN